jgi:hypothetical protein
MRILLNILRIAISQSVLSLKQITSSLLLYIIRFTILVIYIVVIESSKSFILQDWVASRSLDGGLEVPEL